MAWTRICGRRRRRWRRRRRRTNRYKNIKSPPVYRNDLNILVEMGFNSFVWNGYNWYLNLKVVTIIKRCEYIITSEWFQCEENKYISWICLNSLRCGINFQIIIFVFHGIISWALPMKFPPGVCYRTLMLIYQLHLFRSWLATRAPFY